MDTWANFINGKCYLCNKGFGVICDRCFSRLEEAPKNTNSLYMYNETASKILLQSKYPPYNFYLLKHLINRRQIPYNFPENSLFCPIPISPLKEFERKFNQSEVISSCFSRKFKIPTVDLLRRIRNSKPLFNLNPSERSLELINIFKAKYLTKLFIPKDTPVILVDDLVTTGETLFQASKALKNIGLNKINYLTLFSV